MGGFLFILPISWLAFTAWISWCSRKLEIFIRYGEIQRERPFWDQWKGKKTSMFPAFGKSISAFQLLCWCATKEIRKPAKRMRKFRRRVSLQIFLMSWKPQFFAYFQDIIHTLLDGAIDDKAVRMKFFWSAQPKSLDSPGCAGCRICFNWTKWKLGWSNFNFTGIWFKRPLARGHRSAWATRPRSGTEDSISFMKKV